MAKGKIAKGLSDLLGGTAAPAIQEHEIRIIELDKIKTSPTNPRKNFDQDSINDLAESMRTTGLIQPITLRVKGDKYEIVAGERRFRAAKLLGWTGIKSSIVDVSDEQVLEIQIIENLQREDVRPIDEAFAFASLLKKESIDWLASKIHKSKKYIADRLKLNDLVELGREYLSSGALPLTHAIVISKLKPEEQDKAIDYAMSYDSYGEGYDKMVCDKTVSELKWHIVSSLMVAFKDACFDLSQDNLVDGVCACNVCPKRTTNQNLLFSDITEEDKCTDAACYQAKEKAHIKLATQSAKNKFDKGSVFSGEISYGSNQVTVQGIDLPCSKTKTKGKDMAAVVVTKTKYGGDKKRLGTVVYIERDLLTKGKNDEKASTTKSPGYRGIGTWQDQQKKRFATLAVPRLDKLKTLLDGGTPANRNKIVEQYFIDRLESEDLRDVLVVAKQLGFYESELSNAEMWNIDEEFEEQSGDGGFSSWKRRMRLFGSIVNAYSFNELVILLALIKCVDDEDRAPFTEKDREDMEAAHHNWPELEKLLAPEEDSNETKAAPARKGRSKK